MPFDSKLLSRWKTFAVLALPLVLGACTDVYLARRDTIMLHAGDAVATNKVVHMIDPWPAGSGNREIESNGVRAQRAAERYRNNAVTPLRTTSTSSVQYAPVMFAPPSGGGNSQ